MSTILDQTHPDPSEPNASVMAQTGLPVAQYVRMSTELQCYSTQNQREAIGRYAKAHGMNIVSSFSDEGKSGLTLDRRPGLLSLLSVVQKGLADFKAILVYDVSRWGRFQDIDESSYWEYLCKRAGVVVHYCAEPFSNDNSLQAVIFKTLKRTMAAEYSRELSAKVFAGQCRLVELGFHLGGAPGFGLRRVLVDREGHSKGILAHGEMKSIQSDRVVLVPGPEEEQQVIREIFHLFVAEGKTQVSIAKELNARAISLGRGRRWNQYSVHQVLSNPKYIGTSLFNRRSVKLHGSMIQNAEELWIRKEDAFPALVSRDEFDKAAKIMAQRNHVMTEDELLHQLRSVLAKNGKITGALINQSKCTRGSGRFFTHFGGLRHAYEKLGYVPERDFSFWNLNHIVKATGSKLLEQITCRLQSDGAVVEIDHKAGTLKINGEFTVRCSVARCLKSSQGELRWWIPNEVEQQNTTWRLLLE